MVSMASASGTMLEPGSETASLSPASPSSSSFYAKSNGGRSPGINGSFEPASGAPFAEYLKTWTDQHVSRWLTEIKCSKQAAAFQANDIRGDVLLELDQATLKEIGVTSIGDRLRIVNAVKNLRQRCSTRSATPGFESSPRTQSRLFLNSDPPTISHSMSDSLDGSPTSRLAGRLGTVRPPPLHISSNSQSEQSASSHGEPNFARGVNPPMRPLPQPNHASSSSHPSIPTLRPLPNTSRMVSPSIRTPSRLHMGRGGHRAPDQADPSAFANSPLPPAPGSRADSPFGINHNSKGSLQVGSSAVPSSRGSSRTPALNPIHTRNVSSQGGATSPGPSPRLHAYAAAEPPSSYSSGDSRTLVGSFTNESPGTPSHQANLSYDDLRRKLFKFQLYEEGHSKVINISECPGGVEIMDTVLKKFGKGGARSSDFLDEVETANGGLIVDGWAVHLDWGMGDGLGNPLTEAELMAICHAAFDDPVRERGLTLRRTAQKRPKALANFLGEESIPDFARNQSPTAGSDSDGNTAALLDGRAKALNDLQNKRKTIKRASAISVLSALGVQNPERVLDPTSSPAPISTPTASAGLKLPQRFRSFFGGQRPPSEFIADNAAAYFPFTEKKVLARTARNSIYRQSTISTMSNIGDSGVPPLPSRNSDSNSSFSPGRTSTDLPPPVPEKILSPAAANFPREPPPRVSISTETGDVVEATDEMPTPINKRMSQMSLNSTYSGRQSKRTSMIELRSSVHRSDKDSLVTLDEITASVERRRESKIFDDTDSWTGVHVAQGEEAAFPSPAISQSDLPETEDSVDVDVDVTDDVDTDDDDDDDMSLGEDSDDSKEDAKTPVAKGAANSKWMKGALIGAGSFGKVYLGMDAKTARLMAVKQVELPTGSGPNEERKKAMLSALELEIDLLKELQHPNIVQYLDSALDSQHLNIFLEYVSGGSITAMLRVWGAFDEELGRTFTKQMLLGLSYLHERNIIHRDIKGANILVEPSGHLKISDFGISKRIGGANLLGKRMNRPSLQGSVFWMAPEVVKQKAHTTKADIWSVGCLVVEMLTGEHPWAQLTQMQAIFKIGSSAKPEIPPDISNEAEDFLQKTFDLDYEARSSANDLLEHPWILGKKLKAKTTTTLEVPTPA